MTFFLYFDEAVYSVVIKNQTQKDQDPILPVREIGCGTSGSHLTLFVSTTKHIKDFIGIIFLIR